MSDDTFSGSDFSAAASASSAAASSPATEETTAPVTTESTDPAATVQAAATDDTTTPPVTEQQGPIPFKVHHTALENARQKAIEEYKAKVGWAESVNREHVEQMQRMGQLYATDPKAFVRQFLSEGTADPELAAIIREETARLHQRREPQAELADKPIPIVGENNEVIGTLQDVVERMLAKRIDPLQQDLDTRRQRETHDAEQREVEALIAEETSNIRESVFTLPEFEAHKPEVLAKAREYVDANKRISVEAALHRAYNAIVLPKLAKTERAKVLGDLQSKPAASSVSPSSGTTAIPKPDSQKDWTELFAEKAAAAGLA